MRRITRETGGRGARIQFFKEAFTFTGDDAPTSNLLLRIMGALAEFERPLIKERWREGIALAKARGVYSGRKKTLSEEQIAQLKEKVGMGIPQAKVAREFGVKWETVYQ